MPRDLSLSLFLSLASSAILLFPPQKTFFPTEIINMRQVFASSFACCVIIIVIATLSGLFILLSRRRVSCLLIINIFVHNVLPTSGEEIQRVKNMNGIFCREQWIPFVIVRVSATLLSVWLCDITCLFTSCHWNWVCVCESVSSDDPWWREKEKGI